MEDPVKGKGNECCEIFSIHTSVRRILITLSPEKSANNAQ